MPGNACARIAARPWSERKGVWRSACASFLLSCCVPGAAEAQARGPRPSSERRRGGRATRKNCSTLSIFLKFFIHLQDLQFAALRSQPALSDSDDWPRVTQLVFRLDLNSGLPDSRCLSKFIYICSETVAGVQNLENLSAEVKIQDEQMETEA